MGNSKENCWQRRLIGLTPGALLATTPLPPAPACTLCILKPTGTSLQMSGDVSLDVHWGDVVVMVAGSGRQDHERCPQTPLT